MAAAPSYEVEAAGGLIWRRRDGGIEVLVVHRPRYDDWSFPKGKRDPGERHRETAQREVLEEVGLTVDLGPRLADVRYQDHKGRSKRVKYWAMVRVDGAFAPNDEVDEVRWLRLDAAADVLTYAHDRPLLDELAAVAPVA